MADETPEASAVVAGGDMKSRADGHRLFAAAILLTAALLVYYLAQSYYAPPPPAPAEAEP